MSTRGPLIKEKLQFNKGMMKKKKNFRFYKSMAVKSFGNSPLYIVAKIFALC